MAAISLAQRRARAHRFFFLAGDFRREKENEPTRTRHVSTHPRVLGKSRSREASFTVSGTWSSAGSFGMATGRGTGHLLSALLLSILIESRRQPRRPFKSISVLCRGWSCQPLCVKFDRPTRSFDEGRNAHDGRRNHPRRSANRRNGVQWRKSAR